jgi:transposase
MVAPISGAGGQAVKFARVDAVTSDIVEIVIGDVVVRVGSDLEPERLAAVIRAVRQA